MAEFNVKYHYQSREGGSWGGTSTNISFQSETPSAAELKTLVMAKNRNYYDVRISQVEKRGSSKVDFSVRFHYKRREGESGNGCGTSTKVSWYNDNPSMSDIEALVLGYKYDCYSVSVDDIKKN